MISNEQILACMEKRIEQAKRASTNAEMREQISAVQALCEVLLLNKEEISFNVQTISNVSHTTTNTFSTKKQIEEDGANGDSIFDF